jgi:hypothetical protein
MYFKHQQRIIELDFSKIKRELVKKNREGISLTPFHGPGIGDIKTGVYICSDVRFVKKSPVILQ